jgi:hypothetical protein
MKILREALRNLILLVVTCIILFVLIELGFRIAAYVSDRQVLDDRIRNIVDIPEGQSVHLGQMIEFHANERIIYRLRPNLSVNYIGAEVKTNAEGFRGKDHSLDKGEDDERTLRVVGIGDSVMFGQGVPTGFYYLSFLETFLNARPGSSPWEVINTAVPGYNTVMELETLKEEGLRYSPDVVILGFVNNDLSLPNFIRFKEPYFSLKKSFFKQYVERIKLAYPYYEQLSALRSLNQAPARGRNTSGLSRFEDDPAKVPLHYRDMVGWGAFEQAVSELAGLSKENGFAVIVVFVRHKEDEVSSRAMDICKAAGFYIVDTEPTLKDAMRKYAISDYYDSILTVEGDSHPSALTHKLIAGDIYSYMFGAGLVNGPQYPAKEKY